MSRENCLHALDDLLDHTASHTLGRSTASLISMLMASDRTDHRRAGQRPRMPWGVTPSHGISQHLVLLPASVIDHFQA